MGCKWPGEGIFAMKALLPQSDPEPMKELMRTFSRHTDRQIAAFPYRRDLVRSSFAPRKYVGNAKDPKAVKPEDVIRHS